MASLTTTSNSGEQTTTQSPQASVGSAPATAQAGSVQPGTANNLLTSQNGQSLSPTPLSTIDLSGGAASTGQLALQPTAVKHHFNPVLGGAAVLLFVVAVALFWSTSRSVKNTTY